jgi:hypothetical protein
MDAPRVIHDASTEVKGPDGAPAVYRYTTIYDPVSGEYIRTVTDEATKEVLRREVTRQSVTAPSKEEDAFARAFIEADPEIAALIAGAEYPVKVSGGFVLMQDEGLPCGPGTRCLQYDVLEMLPDRRTATRIRYVIVDVRTGRFVTRNFDPALQRAVTD